MKIEENTKKAQAKAKAEAKKKTEEEKAKEIEARRQRAEERQKEALMPKVNKQTIDVMELYKDLPADAQNVELRYERHSRAVQDELDRQDQ